MKFAPLIAVAVLILHTAALQAKLGESVPQLTKRFGSRYTVEQVAVGERYRFRLKQFSVDVIVSGGVSTCETYYSYTALDAQGRPPNAIVQGVLHTNVPKAKWREIVANYFGADYALRSEDYAYIATLNYKTGQPEGATWTITVQAARPASPAQAAAASTTVAQPPAQPPPASDAVEVVIRNADLAKVRNFMIEGFRRSNSGAITDAGANFITYGDQVMTDNGIKVRLLETFSLFGEGEDVRVKVRVKAIYPNSAGVPVEQALSGDMLEKAKDVVAAIKKAMEPSSAPVP